jgi:hypothetical protein
MTSGEPKQSGRIARVRYMLPRHKATNCVGPGRGRKCTRPGANGVVELSSFEFLDRLADLVPPPRKHRHRYHGVFAPNHRLRKAVTAMAIGNVGKRGEDTTGWHAAEGGGDSRLIAFITAPGPIRKILSSAMLAEVPLAGLSFILGNPTHRELRADIREMSMLRRLVSLVILVAAPLASARADTTYATLAGNLAASSQTNGSIQFFPLPGTTFAQRFTTATLPTIGDGDGSGQILYRFSWDLLPAQGPYDPTDPENPFPNLDTTYQVNLLSDASGLPGSSLLLSSAIGTATAPGVVNFLYADLVNDPRVSLQSNTAYWLTVAFQSASASVGVPLLLPYTTDSTQTGPGTIDALMVDTGSGWGGISGRAVVQVQVETVPEPSTIVLVAAGAALLGWRWMRRPGGHPASLREPVVGFAE